MIKTIQEQALATYSIKFNQHRKNINTTLFRLYGVNTKSISHATSGCCKLV